MGNAHDVTVEEVQPSQDSLLPASGARRKDPVRPLDPEGKINSGQFRTDPRDARHSSYRPYQR
jgi:hypothetical protein